MPICLGANADDWCEDIKWQSCSNSDCGNDLPVVGVVVGEGGGNCTSRECRGECGGVEVTTIDSGDGGDTVQGVSRMVVLVLGDEERRN